MQSLSKHSRLCRGGGTDALSAGLGYWRGKSRDLITGTGRHRLIGFTAALVLGSLVAVLLFEIMGRLARAPIISRRLSPPLTVSVVPLPEVSRPTRRARPPPSATAASAAKPSPPARLHPERPARHVSRRVLALHFAVPPVFSPANASPAVSQKSTYIDWQRSLNAYFREREKKPAPFRAPALLPRPPSVLDLPARMRFSGGTEIDRIGDTCYAVTADEASTRPLGANTLQLRLWRSSIALLGHKVPCLPGLLRSPGQELLDRLSKRGYPKKPPGP